MLCRLCLYECELDSAFSLFLHNGDETNVTKLIAKYVKLEITLNDTLSTMICIACNKHLEDFDQFLERVEQRQNELRNEFMEVKCVPQDDAQAITVNELNNANLDYNEESLLDIKDVFLANETPIEFGEALDSEREDNVDINTASGFDNEDEDDLPLTELTKLNKSEQKPTTTKEKVIRKRKKTLYKKKSKEKGNKLAKGKTENTNNRDNENYKALNRERDDFVTKHMKMKCELCDVDIKTYKELKIHFRDTHKTRAFIVCCGIKLFRRFKIMDHINVHLNPNYFQCKLCNKVLSSRTCMDVHNANTHADKSNLKHPCPMCDRRFAHMPNLQAHLLSHSQERKFECDECKKSFKTAYMLKVHKQKMHEVRQYYICDTCGKEYRFKPSFLRHVAEHATGATGPTEECPICGKLLCFNGLRRHLDRHNVQEIECNICGKKLKSKAALKGHIDYAHKKTRSYNCTFCDKSFKRPCVLKEHIAMHTGQKLYNCPNCPREFRSKANMYSHNKKAHRAEWEKANNQTLSQQKIEPNEETSNQIETVANATC